jgi:hypothetical protein
MSTRLSMFSYEGNYLDLHPNSQTPAVSSSRYSPYARSAQKVPLAACDPAGVEPALKMSGRSEVSRCSGLR